MRLPRFTRLLRPIRHPGFPHFTRLSQLVSRMRRPGPVWRWMAPAALALFVVGTGWGADGVAGQARGGAALLDAAEVAMGEGRLEAARDAVDAWWEGGESGRDRAQLQRAFWLRARLTVEPEPAELLYRRLVVEFPGGTHSDEALLRLAQGALARGESEAGRRFLEILIRDYPASPHRVAARAELARLETAPSGAAGGAPARTPITAPPARTQAGPPPAAPPRPPAASATPPTTPPVTPPGAPPVTPPTTPPVTPPTGAPSAAPGAAGGAPLPSPAENPWTLQFGAFSTLERARAVAAELRLAGLAVRVVQVEGSPLFRIRGEAFPTREAAERRAAELRDRGFELLVSGDRPRETLLDGGLAR